MRPNSLTIQYFHEAMILARFYRDLGPHFGACLGHFELQIGFKIDSGIEHPTWRPNGGFRSATGDVRWPLWNPKSKGPWSLRAWDEDFGCPYMSFGQSITPHSLVAP